jgi:acetyltransferase-like isoleucine patch superfamily enzyme
MERRMEIKNIHPTAVIGDDVIIECNEFTLGANSVIKNGCTIRCNKFIAKEGLYMCEGVEIGRGGCNGPNSNVYIGSNVGIFERTIINPSDEVHIGDNVGIGGEVMIWTHGAWLDVMQGFPAEFGPVKIGNNVWLPARSIVLPNVEIGDNTVIGIGSIINKNIPPGSLAAGSPCKVIKENYYPKVLSDKEKLSILKDIVQDYIKLAKFKNIKVELKVNNNDLILSRYVNAFDGIAFTIEDTIFNLDKKTIHGYEDEFSEDLRDYLRRRGIKIFTNKPFKSI